MKRVFPAGSDDLLVTEGWWILLVWSEAEIRFTGLTVFGGINAAGVRFLMDGWKVFVLSGNDRGVARCR